MSLKLKAKILIGVSFVLLVAIVFNIFFSYDLFLKDKRSYIYENGLQRAETLSDTIVSAAESAFSRVSSFAYLALTNEDQFQKVIDSEKEIKLFAILPNKSGEQWRSFANSSINDDGTQTNEVLLKWFSDNKDDINFSKEYSTKTVNVDEVDYLLVTIKNEELRAVYLLSLQKVFASIVNDRVFNHSVFNKRNNSLLKDIKPPKYAKRLNNEKLKRGTKKFKIGDENLLVSFVKFPSFDFTLASEITEEKAYAITKDLVRKSIFFGMILLGGGLLLGVFFSLRITKPINSLVAATHWVAKGDFSKRIDIQTSDELKVLGDSFNYMSGEINQLLDDKQDMIEQLEDANLKLEDYSKNLEQMVEERTAELKKANDFIGAMINSLDQGLFVIDKDLNCADVYTRACEDIFGQTPGGKNFNELLDLNEKEANAASKWAGIVFSKKIPFQSAKKLGPQKKVYGEDIESDDFKHVEIDYYPMEEGDELNNIVVVSTDKTAEIKAHEAFVQKEKYVEMIIKLVKRKKQFYNFFDEAESILETIGEELKPDRPIFDNLLINYHSLNGGFGTFSVLKLQQMARECEQNIVDFKEVEFTDEHLKVLRDDYEHYMFEFNEFKEEIKLIFGADESTQEVNKDLVVRYAEVLRERGDEEMYQLFVDYFTKDPIAEQFQSYIELVDRLSKQLKKPINPVVLNGGDVRVDVKKTKEFISSLVHLFRNCCDHGIEKDVNKRIELGKEEAGTITVNIDKLPLPTGDGEDLVVIVTDDGGGINPTIIRNKLQEKNPGEDYSQISDEDIIYKIFDPSFSTAEQVTSVSGRGVGMSAIKDVLDRSGGKIILKSKVDEGTRFEFHLPMKNS